MTLIASRVGTFGGASAFPLRVAVTVVETSGAAETVALGPWLAHRLHAAG